MRLRFWRWRRGAEIDEELQSHLKMAARERVERGESPDAAAAAARRELGNAALIREVTRDQWRWRWLGDLLQDLRHGVRMLRKDPGFTLTVIFTLALGIGLNSTIFSMVNGLLFHEPPVKNPESVVVITLAQP